ncbi:MAG: divalent metal cation transporter [Candidatus Paceibacterota bacterium]|jgi:NRAMP (natural resistance-associated macrophage protein)-like metal ion transporter
MFLRNGNEKTCRQRATRNMTLKKKIKKWLRVIGPGFITGAADDDPSGIATYSQTGALFGYAQVWIALFATPFMIAIQEASARIGLITGKGLAKNIKQHYPAFILYASVFLVVIANIINIGADLGAMAASTQLLFPAPFILLLVLFGLTIAWLEIRVPYKKYANALKWLGLSLFAYLITAFIVKQDWGVIAHSFFVPSISFSREYWINIVALLGTTISPYLFFWQADEEVEEEIARHELARSKEDAIPHLRLHDVRAMRWDTIVGMIFSNAMTFFIIITAAATLGAHHILNVQTAEQAAQALLPLGGRVAFVLFTLGIVGTGLLAIPVLAGSASYALSETLGWKTGLYRSFKRAKGFYGIIAAATLIGMLINLMHIPAFSMLYYAAVLNGLAAPPLMFLITHMAKNKAIMGEHASSPLFVWLGWAGAGAMTIASLALLFSLFI